MASSAFIQNGGALHVTVRGKLDVRCRHRPRVTTRGVARRVWVRACSERGKGEGGEEDIPEDSDEEGDKSKEEREPHDIPQSFVDWNSEWTSFVQAGYPSNAPKGREPPSKEALAARRALASVKNTVDRVAGSVPSRQALFRDWRFWIAIILALSFFSAFVQSTTPGTNLGGPQI